MQRSGRLIVHFSPPTETTEGMTIKTPPRLDLRVGTAVAPFNAEAWASDARKFAPAELKNGLAEYEIPAADWVGKDITIGARSIGSNGKDSAWSFVNLAVVPSPPAPSNVTPVATAAGVKLTWRGDPGEYLVFRRAGDEKNFAQVGKAATPEFVDATAEFGKPYTYEVQRIAPAGKGVAESELSEPSSITPIDTFPPAAPPACARSRRRNPSSSPGTGTPSRISPDIAFTAQPVTARSRKSPT